METNLGKSSSSSSNSSSVDEDKMQINIHEQDAAGVVLTWENLWVDVSDGKSGNRSILQGLTGYARPGEILAILGPSGCGKSTFLDALAGRLDSNTRQSGEILVNGHKQALAYGTSAYVTQDDALITTLTVREAMYYSAQLQLPKSMPRAMKMERANTTIREMGLQDCIDTRIGGGWGSKGLSGGQIRRVSICIEILTHPKLLFLDEPTSGLDSAASYYVMSRIARLENREGRTIIASIHQPSCEVFALFHNLCLLSAGRTVYFGPASSANEFFSENGFLCPIMQNPSDHFLRTINKDFDEDIEQGGADGRKPTEEVIHLLISSYKSSVTYKNILTQVSTISKQEGGALEKKRSHADFITQCLVLTERSFVNMYRDLGYYWLRLGIYIFLAIGLGTIFYRLGSNYDSIEPKCSMLMFVASILTFMTLGGFPSFVEDMKVFGRERLNGHYGSCAFVIGNTFSSLPYLFLVSIAPGAISYYLTGLQNSFEHFAYYSLVIFLCMMLVESLMMIVASIVCNFLMGIFIGAGIQGLMILGTGFFRKPHDMPKIFWNYPVYHIAFHKYAFQGLYKNEFEGTSYQTPQYGTITGEYILRNIWQVEMVYSKWVDLAILLGMVILYKLMFLVNIKSIEKLTPTIRAWKQKNQVMLNPTSANT